MPAFTPPVRVRRAEVAGRDGPWAELRTFTFSPAVFAGMVAAFSPDTEAGDLLAVYDREGRRFGTGFAAPRAPIALRMLAHGEAPLEEAALLERLDAAVRFRREFLRLDETGSAYRLVNSDGDGLGGLVADKFGELLSVEVSNYGAWRRLDRWVPRLHAAAGTRAAVIRVDEEVARLEGIPLPAPSNQSPVKVTEHGVRFWVDAATGHKTGFFCDQRENRRRFAQLAAGRKVLDLCCYSGGFSVAAAVAGAESVTGVDLDEEAVTRARANANLNQKRVEWVHADAFAWARQMRLNGQTWEALVVDPPKFADGREELSTALRKYEDLNGLALMLAAPGALFVTCSCSGLVSAEVFEEVVTRAAHRQNKRLQFFDRTGPGPDHPNLSNSPEGRYLKVLWARVA